MSYWQVLYFIVLVLCGLGLFLCCYGLRRNEQVFKARTELNAFVFADLDDWMDKRQWKDGLPLYAEMASVFPFPPPPLRSFITGRYAKDFWLWRSRGLLRKLDAAEKLVEPPP